MNTREVLLNKILRNLDFFAREVKRNMAEKRTDILIDAEDIFRKLLNEMYGFNLQNANAYMQNITAVDLIDRARRTVVQITAEATIKKIRDTIRKFEELKLHEEYRELMILILDMDPPSTRMREIHASRYRLKVMTLATLFDEVRSLSVEKLEKISGLLASSIGVKDDKQEKSGTAAALVASGEPLTPTHRQVLALASLLPEAGLDQRVFFHGLNPGQRKVLPNLIRQGLLYTVDSSVLCIHHDIRAEYQNELCSGVEYTYFLDRLWHYDKCWHWDRVTLKERSDVRRSLAQIFSLASRLLSDPEHIYAQRSAELWLIAPQYTSALTEARRILDACVPTGATELEFARASDFVGDCYSKLEKYQKALQAWKETLDHCKFLNVSKSELATALHKVGCAHLELKNIDDARTYLMQELQIREELRRSQKFVPDLPGLADVYAKLSVVFLNLGNSQEELLCSANVQRAPAEMHSLWEELTPHLVLPPPTFVHSGFFVGRESCLYEIRDRFHSGNKVVVLSGLGGSGKTAVAIRYAEKCEGRVYYTSFENSFTQTLAGMAWGIRPTLSNEKLYQSADVLCQMVLGLLEDADDRDLLIIDGVESAAESFDDLQKDPAYQLLTKLRLRLLLTTRADVPRAIKVSNIPAESLFKIFRYHGANLSEQEMRDLIRSVNGHTLTVELIALALRGRGPKKVTVEMIQKALREHILPGWEYTPDAMQDRIYQNLRAVFRVVGMTESCMDVMRYATLLPENGMYAELFGTCLKDEEALALNTLIDGGWLTIHNGLLTIHPIIRQICREDLEPTDERCSDYLDALERQWDRMVYDPVKYAQLAEVFSLAADHLEDREAKWVVRGGYFLNSISRYEAAKALCEKHLTDLEDRLKGQPSLAAVYLNLGFAHGKLGSHTTELEFQLKALDILEVTLPENHPELARCYDDIGAAYRELGDHENAFLFAEKALESRGKSPTANPLDLARSYRGLGAAYGALGDHEKASGMKQKALDLLEYILPGDHPELADCCDDMGVTFRELDKHTDAFKLTKKAMEIRQRCLPAAHPDLAVSYHHMGCSYIELGNYSKALEYLRKALEIRERCLPAAHPDLAESYSTVGIFYSDLGDYLQALEYLQKALEIHERILPLGHPVLSASYRNVGDAYEALDEPEKAREYFRKAELSEP